MGRLAILFGKRSRLSNASREVETPRHARDQAPSDLADISMTVTNARERHELPDLPAIVKVLVTIERRTNYATVVAVALESAAEYRGAYIGDLRSAYMKLWWQWHKHPDDPEHRAEKAIVVAAEAAQVYPDSEIGWTMISLLSVWLNEDGPDRSYLLERHFGPVPTLAEIQRYQGTGP